MTSEGQQESQQGKTQPNGANSPAAPSSREPRRQLIPLPAMAVIALYMFVLAGIIILGVAHGYTGPAYLIISAAFICAALGLLMLFRWAWALTLAAVVLMTGLFLWRFTSQHDMPSLMQGLLNLVIFLYLVRAEVRSHLR